MKKGRLLVLLKSVDGGTGTYLEGLLALRKQGYEIRVLGLEKPLYRIVNEKDYKFFSDDRYIPSQYTLSWRILKNLWDELRWVKLQIDIFTPQVVIAQDPHAIVLISITKIVRGRFRLIASIHNNLAMVVSRRLEGIWRKLFVGLFGVLLKKADKVVVVSQALAGDLKKDLALKALPTVISNIVPQRVKTIRRAPTKRGFVIISVSRMDEQKDHETLIRAFERVFRRHKQIRLWLVGDGPKRAELERLVSDLKLNAKVVFWGWYQNPEELLVQSNVFVLSTHWEGFPLSLVEAMRVGLAVVATDCKYGPKEILGDNEYGLLVPEGDDSGLAKALNRLITDGNFLRKMSRLAKSRVIDFSAGEMLASYRQLIDDLVNSDGLD